ncbi:gamma-glutamyl hydrolase B isoform X2 [Anabrus simplex]|uniref:gamma-glutamyl hydrolase B isoform X2 n=1 Tax=Anabrus simplex TaxID=316456 RepID=UPI0035A26E4E
MDVWMLILFAFSFLSKTLQSQNTPLNNRPIIGILTQEMPQNFKEHYTNYNSYIAASYVKYLEGAGARVAPIWIGKDRLYYKKIISSLNGILFPGGATLFTNPAGYAAAGAYLYEYAVKLNNKGNYFPLWGTCLGFELITYLSASQKEIRCNCSALDQASPLNFRPGFRMSWLFREVPKAILDALRNEPVTVHYHQFCVTEKNMTAFGLDKEWRILSTGFDSHGLEFVSSIESRNFPFYAVMFHPEKNAYEWKSTKHIPHSNSAIAVMQYFANFFVNEASWNIQVRLKSPTRPRIEPGVP